MKINQEITALTVRVISNDGAQLGIMSIEQAIKLASDAGLDLVEISATSDPIVCRILDYKKHIFSKKQVSHKQKRTQLKEIQLGLTIGEADYQVKRKKAEGFLQQGHIIKVSLQFKGREIVYSQRAIEIFARLENDLKEYGSVESEPSLNGKQMIMIIKKRGQNAKAKNT